MAFPEPRMEELPWKILNLVAKRGYIGATREDFFREIRGVIYDDLEKTILELERGGYGGVEWLSDSRVLISITDKGSSEGRGGDETRPKGYQDRGAIPKSEAGPEKGGDPRRPPRLGRGT